MKKQNKNKKKKEAPKTPPADKSVATVFAGDLATLEEALGHDQELVLFFLAWLKHGRNATEAYLELNPNVKRESAAVLGSAKLRNIKIELVLEAYGLGAETYLQQLKAGLGAMSEKTGMLIGPDGIQTALTEVPDHKTRRQYHEALGKMLGFESKDGARAGVAVQVNFNQHIQKEKQEFFKEDPKKI